MAKIYVCDAVVTAKVTCCVLADSIEDAKEKFKRGDWDDYDDDGGEVQSVECDLPSTKLDE